MRSSSKRCRTHGRATLVAGVLLLTCIPTPARAAQIAAGDVLAVLAEQSIVRLHPDGTVEPVFSATGAGLQTLYAIATQRSGHVLALAVAGGTRLVRVDPADGTQELIALLPAFGLPFSMALDRLEKAAFFVDYSGDVFRVDLASGAVTTLVSLPSGGTTSFALALAPDGTLYVSDDGQDTLLCVDPIDGSTEVVAEGVEIGGYYRAHGIDVDLDGTVLGTRFDPPAIVRIDPATGDSYDVATGDLLDGPVEIEIDRDGAVLVANMWAGDVVRVDLATGAQAKLSTPYLLTGLAIVRWPECGNGRDDDGDGLSDWAADPGCKDATAPNESPPCQDGLDNDGATGVDFDGGAAANGGVPLAVADPQCTQPWRGERGSGCGLGVELAAAFGLASRLRRIRARR